MKKFIQVLLGQWARNPSKFSLAILALALGTGILVLSFSASQVLQDQINRRMQQEGTVLYVANGSWQSDGSFERSRPAQWDSAAPAAVMADLDAIKAVAVVDTPPFDSVTVGGTVFRLRSAVASDAGYLTLFGLETVAGVPMGDDDVQKGSRKVWLSEELAVILYGSAADAVDKFLQPPGMLFRRGPGGEDRTQMVQYRVAGVYQTPSTLARKAYGIGDLVYPWTSTLSSGNNVQFEKNMRSQVFAVLVKGLDLERAAAYIKSSLAKAYGEDCAVVVWEGTARGSTSYLQELRNTLSVFTVSLNLLGLVLLLASALGIFSIMVVESLNRRRAIALERAIGASRRMVLTEFLGWSLALSLLGSLLGLVLAWLCGPAVMQALAPLAGELSVDLAGNGGLGWQAVAGGIGLALACGGVFGILPAIPAVQGSIADTLREE